MENYFYRKLAFAKLNSGGTSDYSALSNKPQINGVTLEGNKTSEDLGISSGSSYTAGTNIEITEDNVINNTIPLSGDDSRNNLVLGNDNSDGNDRQNIIVGKSNSGGGTTNIIYGCNNNIKGDSSIAIGYGISSMASSARNFIGIGISISNHLNLKNVIALGHYAYPTKENQMVIGSSTWNINEILLNTSNGEKTVATTDQTVPAGGTTGQVLMKNSDADYDYSWTSLTDLDEVSF